MVGVLADLSGKPSEALKPLKDRKVVNIDRDNFNDVLARATEARWPITVKDKLTGGDGEAGGRVEFQANIEDFEPAKIAEQGPGSARRKSWTSAPGN